MINISTMSFNNIVSELSQLSSNDQYFYNVIQ